MNIDGLGVYIDGVLFRSGETLLEIRNLGHQSGLLQTIQNRRKNTSSGM